MRISRSDFLKGLGAFAATTAGLGYWQWQYAGPKFPCRMLGPSREIGHRLRGVNPEEPVELTKPTAQVVIVGGGIAGLSAAWWLKRHGFASFNLFELEANVGGNSSSGKNQYSAYPWGAHYVPIANSESQYVRALFDEIGIISGVDHNSGLPIYDERFLCHEPQERLFKDGIFQEGLVPKRGLQKAELGEIRRFFDLMMTFRQSVGADGRPAFAIPIDLSSRDPALAKLDKISMSDWLRQNHFSTKPLNWYINYCCRDDYGATASNVSAWAGIHYFAGRRGAAANAELNSVVTWPEGNGFLVEKLRKYSSDHIKTDSLVTSVRQRGDHAEVTYYQTNNNTRYRFLCDYVIFSAPRYVAKHVVADCPTLPATDLQYAPWLVANITVRTVPSERGVPIAWDNVSYYSNSLGYVSANNQEISTRTKPVVLTYYYPLSENSPTASRSQLYQSSAKEWTEKIVQDLESMHPGITNEILSIDLWPWGHGMIRPSVGFIWGDTRQRMKEALGHIVFAHSDMSGMSNFEEAQYHGVEAAKTVLKQIS